MSAANVGVAPLGSIEEEKEDGMPSPPRREIRERDLVAAYGQLGAARDVLNERAVAVMKRMSDKLTGRDFLQEVRHFFLASGQLSRDCSACLPNLEAADLLPRPESH